MGVRHPARIASGGAYAVLSDLEGAAEAVAESRGLAVD